MGGRSREHTVAIVNRMFVNVVLSLILRSLQSIKFHCMERSNMLVAARKGLGKLHLNGRWIEMLEINWFEEVI